MSLAEKLPKVRGSYREKADLSKVNWFNIGGPAEVMFRPEDTEDLSYFLKNKSKEIPVTILGVGSNLLVRDGGIDGVVIRLGRNFVNITHEKTTVIAGAGALDQNVAIYASQNGIGGLEFMIGIPGTVGGALAMNAGAYSSDISNILVSAEAVDMKGDIRTFSKEDFGFKYRSNSLPKDIIFTKAVFSGHAEKPEKIKEKMDEISRKREETQPVRSRTSGSTFKNPEGYKAWELIDKAGLRGFKVGSAEVSEKHCNFFINTGGATAEDVEKLGEIVIDKVKEKFGITLEWEVKIIGKRLK